MPGPYRHCLWRRLICAGVLFVSICPNARAEESIGFVKDAEQYIAAGNLRAAEIELKNAARRSPQDPVIRARLAEVCLQLGNAAGAWPTNTRSSELQCRCSKNSCCGGHRANHLYHVRGRRYGKQNRGGARAPVFRRNHGELTRREPLFTTGSRYPASTHSLVEGWPSG